MTQWGLDTLFNPAKRHMDEEKRRLQATREEAGDSSGGKRIDLESGKVTIRRSTDNDETDEPDGGADTADTADTADSAERPDRGARSPARRREERGAPSPAAIRAARRRGREPR